MQPWKHPYINTTSGKHRHLHTGEEIAGGHWGHTRRCVQVKIAVLNLSYMLAFKGVPELSGKQGFQHPNGKRRFPRKKMTSIIASCSTSFFNLLIH